MNGVNGIALILHSKVGNALFVNGFIRQQLQCVITVEMVSLIRFQVQQLATQLLIGCIMSLKQNQKSQRKDGEMGMTYKRGQVSISVHQLDGFGKNPSLWIGTEDPNQMVKVASFGNEDKANLFCKWFEYLLGMNDDEELVKWE